METFCQMRNTTRQCNHRHSKLDILMTFMVKLRNSGYSMDTVDNVMDIRTGVLLPKREGLAPRWPPTQLQGDAGCCTEQEEEAWCHWTGGLQRWMGGKEERERKNDGWRQGAEMARKHQGVRRPPWTQARLLKTANQVLRGPGWEGQQGEPNRQTLAPGNLHSMVETTLVVPYTLGSALQKRMQEVEDEFLRLVCTRRVRMTEAGGMKLIHTLGQNDPWSHLRVCDDPKCPTCKTKL